MRSSIVLGIAGLAIGVAVGWQGQVHAASRDGREIRIPLGDAAVMQSIGEVCGTGRRRGSTGYPIALCRPIKPRVGQYEILLTRDSIEITKETLDGKGHGLVFAANQPSRIRQ